MLTKEKIYILIKLSCEISSDGIWRVNDEAIEKYNLNNTKFSEIFSGYPPKFEVTFGRGQFSKSNTLNRSLNQSMNKSVNKSKTEEKPKPDSDESEIDENNPESQEFANKIVKILCKKVRDLTSEEFTIWRDYTVDDEDKELLQIEFEADKIFKREEKERERKRQIEEKKKQIEYLKELKKPREDLECDNLVDLPKPIPIKSKLTQEMFGDALMILEFLNNFV